LAYDSIGGSRITVGARLYSLEYFDAHPDAWVDYQQWLNGPAADTDGLGVAIERMERAWSREDLDT
jgi:hypothetical protein